MKTMLALSPRSASSFATFNAPAKDAPEEIPAKIPHSSTKRRVISMLSRGRTMRLRSRMLRPFHNSNTGGMYPSSKLRKPSTNSPSGGSTATI